MTLINNTTPKRNATLPFQRSTINAFAKTSRITSTHSNAIAWQNKSTTFHHFTGAKRNLSPQFLNDSKQRRYHAMPGFTVQ